MPESERRLHIIYDHPVGEGEGLKFGLANFRGETITAQAEVLDVDSADGPYTRIRITDTTSNKPEHVVVAEYQIRPPLPEKAKHLREQAVVVAANGWLAVRELIQPASN